jgi:hypothetical protein
MSVSEACPVEEVGGSGRSRSRSRAGRGASMRRRSKPARWEKCTMDDAKVLRACHLLHEALCDDLELKQLLVQVDQDRVSLTIHQTRGTKESKVIIGEDPASDNIHPLDRR